MKVLLAYPRFPSDTFWSFDRALQLAGRKSTMPPLGLLTVAGMFTDASVKFELADENVAPITDHDIALADIVLASAMIVQGASLARLVQRCRDVGTPIIVGGPYVSAGYRELVEDGLDPDVWFVGEAETVFGQVLADLEAGRLRRAYAHVVDDEAAESLRQVFGDEAHVHIGERPDLDRAPMPRFDLLDLTAYHSMAVQASRGCPIGCEFCDIWSQFGLKSRTGGADRITDQLDFLFALGWRGRVFVVDDNFIGNVGAASQLLPALEAWQQGERSFALPHAARKALGLRAVRKLRGRWRRARRVRYPFALSTEADVRIGHPAPKMTAIRNAMASAGFNAVFLGIETPSAAALREIGKAVNIGRETSTETHLLDSVHRIREAGLEVLSGFIVGFDHDPADIDEAMIEFIERAAIPVAMVGLLAVGPGTALEARLRSEGRLTGRSRGSQTHGFRLEFTPKGRSEQTVVAQYVRVLDAVYGSDMRAYFRRCERAMNALPRAPRTGDRVGLRELRALARSLVAIRPRRAYWGFLGRTLLRRPRSIAHAVVMALQGDHLHRLTRTKLEEYAQLNERNERRHVTSRVVAALEVAHAESA